TAKPSKPSAEMVSLWFQSFDNLLHDKTGLDLFREYLRLEFSEENLEFWIACEQYKTCPTHELAQQSQQIFADYVAIQAPREINLDSKTRDEVYKRISKPDKKTFEDAQYRIQALMAKDSYPRFMSSEFLKKWLAQFKIKINQSQKK
ncbi:hypothetical protein HELRODRAFT_71510, partial [Helobdella robusta]|uniref:RGS domain-containing protein n=1 Tax=Helobdella robusta TaxID=6412 RepID=T1G0M4_HELRO